MRRDGRSLFLILVSWLIAEPSVMRADEPVRPSSQVTDPVDRILNEWHRHASKISSLEVKFQREDRTKAWGSTKSQGRCLLASPNLALLESTPLDPDGKPLASKERMIWNGRDVLRFVHDEGVAYRWNYVEEWSRPPLPLCLPFLFAMTVDRAKQKYQWQIVDEDERRVILMATSRVKPNVFDLDLSPEKYLIELDKKTYFPQKIMLPHSAYESTVFSNIEVKLDSLKNLEEMKKPSVKSWRVIESSMPSEAEIRRRDELLKKGLDIIRNAKQPASSATRSKP